jgi:hypothetical protein
MDVIMTINQFNLFPNNDFNDFIALVWFVSAKDWIVEHSDMEKRKGEYEWSCQSDNTHLIWSWMRHIIYDYIREWWILFSRFHKT